MKTRREFLKALGVSAIVAPAAVAKGIHDPAIKAKEAALPPVDSIDPIGDVRHKRDSHFYSQLEINSILKKSNQQIRCIGGLLQDAERPEFIAPTSFPHYYSGA